MHKNLKGVKTGVGGEVPAGLYGIVCKASGIALYVYKLEDPRDNASLRLIVVNPAGAAIVGLKAAAMKGRFMQDLFPDMARRGLVDKCADVVRKRRGFRTAEFFYERKGWPGIWYSVKTFPLPGDCMGVLLEDIIRFKKNEARLSLAARHLESIINTIGSPIFIKDRKHRWIILNDALCNFMGHPRSSLIGKSDYDFFPKNEADVFWEKDELVFKTRKKNVNEELLTDATGQVHTILTTKRVFKDANSNDILVGVIHDVTEIKKANASLKLFRTLLERSNDAFYIVDPKDGSFLDFTRTACRRLGYTRKTMLCMRVSDIETKLKDKKEWDAIVKKVAAKGSMLFIGEHKRRDGSVFSVEVNLTFTKVGGREFLLAAARDISERLKLEDATRELKTLQGLVPICARCKNIRNANNQR